MTNNSNFATKEWKKPGIYCIENTINKKCYIGSSLNVSQRLYDHRKTLRKNIHYNGRLQNAWNKYGEDNFIFFPLRFVERDILLQTEQEYFDTHNPSYNICLTAERPQPRCIEIHQYTLSGEYLSSFYSIKEAGRLFNTTDTSIINAEKGKQKTAGGYRWSKIKYPKLDPIDHEVGRTSTVVLQYSLEGTFIREWASMAKASRELKCSQGNISRCTLDKGKSGGGYLWRDTSHRGIDKIEPYRRKLTYKKLGKFSIEGSLLHVFESLKQASLESGLSSTGLHCAISGKWKMAGGYVWKYIKNE